jgi:NitT/TauT family transport system permease protein
VTAATRLQMVTTERNVQARRLMRRVHAERALIIFLQLLILAVFLGLWEGLTRIPWFIEHTIFDPFFISQPSRIAATLYDWLIGNKTRFFWPQLWSTLSATFIGLGVALVSGFGVGLLLSQYRFAARVLNPFIVGLNSMPRSAFVPLITMLFGLGMSSKVVTAWFVVFFLVFFNTYKGSANIERELIDFCRTLGGNHRQITMRVRVPMALAWTFAAVPNAVSFALLGVVLSEFIGSPSGIGYLMVKALASLNASEMFAAISVLGFVGVGLVSIARLAERRILHWSPEFREPD